MAKNINYKPKIIIIGSGISGYAGAVICLKQGYEVNIIEKNDYIGGKNGQFNKHPLLYYYPKKMLIDNQIFEELNIKPQFIDSNIAFVYKTDNQSLCIYNDITKLFNELLNYSINDEKNIIELINLIKQGQLFYINSVKPQDFFRFFEYSKEKKKHIMTDKINSKYHKISIKEYFSKFNSVIIRRAFSCILPENCSMSSLIFYLGLITCDKLKCVKNDLIEELNKEFNDLGGKILLGKCVTKFDFNHLNHVSNVVLDDDKRVEGDYFISAIDPLYTYNNLLKKKYIDRKLNLKFNNYYDYYLNRKFIVCFLISENIVANEIFLEVNEFGFNTQRFNYLHLINNGKYLYCVINQNKNDYDYLKILLNKPIVLKKIYNELIDLVITNFKKHFPKTKISYVDIVTPFDIENEFNCYEGYTSGFFDMPNGSNIVCDLVVPSINNLFLCSSNLSQNGGIFNGLVNGKFSALTLIRTVENEKEKR